MQAMCIVVGLLSLATLAASVQNVVLAVVVFDREQNTDRIFLINGSLDNAANTISFVNPTACELLRDNSITKAPTNYGSVDALLQLQKKECEVVNFTFANGTIEDMLATTAPFKWNQIFHPTPATPKGTYQYAINYEKK